MHSENADQLCEKDRELYLTKSDPEECECDAHGIEFRKTKYKQLADKECRLYDELRRVNSRMINLTSLMLSTCDVEETMKSVYETDYEKRGLSRAKYRPLMVAIDSSVRSPIAPAIISLKNVYKDPSRFRYSAMDMECPTIEPAKTMADLKVSEACSLWDEPFIACSEYMDTISRMGLSYMKNQQRYLKPLVPSRNFSDCSSSKST
ncbi:hypothetical protein HN011_007413 [Eciton burchellii]|nr:hypothetical protein HN011_007413 [Eciton burchellii]